jgi:predicted MFS family arabinose efflux permease
MYPASLTVVTMPGSLNSLIWLTLGAFAIGTEGFMIAGLLPTLARDLNVGLVAAGHLVTRSLSPMPSALRSWPC